MAGLIGGVMQGGQEDPAYEKLVAGALRILRNEEMINDIEGSLQEENPAASIARIAYGVITGIGDRAGGIEEEHLFPLAGEVLGYLSEAAAKMGRPLNSAELGQAFFEMLASYSLEQGASMSEVEQLRGEMDFNQIGAQIDQGGAPGEETPEGAEEPEEPEEPEEEENVR